jgi:hypothetical protein
MRKELDEKLCAKYPEIFRDRNAPMTHTCMCWGFDCGDGWYNIIDALCANIKAHVDNHNRNVQSNIKYQKIRDAALNGDWSLFNEDYERLYPSSLIDNTKYWTEEKAKEHREQMMKDLISDIPDWFKDTGYMESPVAVQVKEKYGTLRFYYDGGDRYIDGLANMAESMSAVTCEECGSPGKTLGGGWIRTLCKIHAEEHHYDWDQSNEDDQEWVESDA